MKEFIPPDIPCMYNYKKPCIGCNGYSDNLINLHKLTINPLVKRILNKEGVDMPSIQHICDLLIGFDKPLGTIYLDSTNQFIIMTPKLRELGKTLAIMRQRWLLSASENRLLNIFCPELYQDLKRDSLQLIE